MVRLYIKNNDFKTLAKKILKTLPEEIIDKIYSIKLLDLYWEKDKKYPHLKTAGTFDIDKNEHRRIELYLYPLLYGSYNKDIELNKSFTFFLLHEIGHHDIARNHAHFEKLNNSRFILKNLYAEAKADLFALKHIGKLGFSPLNILWNFFIKPNVWWIILLILLYGTFFIAFF